MTQAGAKGNMVPEPLRRKDIVLYFCIALFILSLIAAAVTAAKIHTFTLGGLTVLVPAGTLAFGLTYLATDAISEIFGRSHALAVVFIGLLMRGVMFLLFMYALHIETSVDFIGTADQWTPERQAAFAAVLESSNRINLAGAVAFGISAVSDVLIFHHLLVRDEGKNLLWLRNNISTIASQTLNSLVFITVAFAGIYSWSAIGSLILGQILVKICVAAFDTPAIYLLRNIAQGRKIFDVSG
ncbi:MAG: queuosine precursor transporter [Maricaulis sp.]|nr:queuosine precursor transporter [Maricaulis sp.]MDG2043892.1 queuosine precursor transporter [Maricaulis sp.]